MALNYIISPSGNHVQIVGIGRITTRDCVGLVKHIVADIHRHSDATALVDLRNAFYRPKNLGEIGEIVKAVKAFHSGIHSKIAIVAKRSTLFLAELFSAAMRRTTPVSIKVFVDVAAAETFCRKRCNKGSSPSGRRPSSQAPQGHSSHGFHVRGMACHDEHGVKSP
ncbi:MAG: STAS/SEC14 domain-containing protein [bacterium]